MDQTINITVTGQELSVDQESVQVAGSVGIYYVKTTYDEAWDSVESKTIVFMPTINDPESPVSYAVEDNGEPVEIPSEVLDYSGAIIVGVIGYAENGAIKITTKVADGQSNRIAISPATVGEGGVDPTTPPQNIWAQVMNSLADLQRQIDDLSGQGDVYTKEEVNQLIEDELAKFDHLDYKVVDELPAIGEAGVRYLVKHISDQRYEEYIYIEGEWYDIGSTEEVDMSNYYDKAEVNTLLGDKADKTQETQILGWTRLTDDTFQELDLNPEIEAGKTRFTILVYMRKGSIRVATKYELTLSELTKLMSKVTTNMLCIVRMVCSPLNNNEMAMLRQCVQAKLDGNGHVIPNVINIKYSLIDKNGTVISGLDNYEWCFYAE